MLIRHHRTPGVQYTHAPSITMLANARCNVPEQPKQYMGKRLPWPARTEFSPRRNAVGDLASASTSEKSDTCTMYSQTEIPYPKTDIASGPPCVASLGLTGIWIWRRKRISVRPRAPPTCLHTPSHAARSATLALLTLVATYLHLLNIARQGLRSRQRRAEGQRRKSILPPCGAVMHAAASSRLSTV